MARSRRVAGLLHVTHTRDALCGPEGGDTVIGGETAVGVHVIDGVATAVIDSDVHNLASGNPRIRAVASVSAVPTAARPPGASLRAAVGISKSPASRQDR